MKEMYEINKEVCMSICGAVGMAACFYVVIIIPDIETTFGRIIIGIILSLVCFCGFIFCILDAIAKIREKHYIRNEQFEIISKFVIRGNDDYCIYFEDGGKKMTVKIDKDSQFSSKYAGKVAEIIELQMPFSLFANKYYLRVEIKSGMRKYFSIIGKNDGYVEPELSPPATCDW